MHQRDRRLVVVDGVLHGLAHEPFGALFRDGLDANARGARETDLLDAEVFDEDVDELLGLGRVGRVLNACVDVLGVFAKDHHVGLLGLFEGAGNPFEVAHRPQADVEVELLTKGHIQRPNATAHRCGEWALDRDDIVFEQRERLIREPDIGPIDSGRLLAAENLHPSNLSLAPIGLGHGRIHDLDHDGGDVHPRAIALDVRNDGLIGNVQRMVGIDRDFLSDAGDDNFARHGNLRRIFSVRIFYGQASPQEWPLEII